MNIIPFGQKEKLLPKSYNYVIILTDRKANLPLLKWP
jgi:hypothetical protein